MTHTKQKNKITFWSKRLKGGIYEKVFTENIWVKRAGKASCLSQMWEEIIPDNKTLCVVMKNKKGGENENYR